LGKISNLAREQQKWSPEICTVLVKAMTKLVNCKHLELIDERGVYKDAANRAHHLDSPLGSCSPWKGMLVDPESYYGTMMDIWSAQDLRPSKGNVSSAHVLHYVAEYLAMRLGKDELEMTLPMKQLTISIGHHIPVAQVFRRTNCYPCEICENYDPYPGLLRLIYNMFETLDRVNLKMNSDQFHIDEAVCDEVAKGLSKANNLRHLELDNYHSHSANFFRALTGLKQARPWPLLLHLSLSGVMSPKHLLKIVNMNVQSLRVLELVDIELVEHERRGPRWDDLVETMQPTLKLERANVGYLHAPMGILRGVFFSTSSRSKSEMNRIVENFMTGKVTKLPRQEIFGSTEGLNPLACRVC
jgi:hypothetical protein